MKIGDRVLFHPDDQYVVDIQEESYLVMRERDLHRERAPEHGTGLYL